MTIKVMLVDDHTMVREALCAKLQHDRTLKVVAEAGDGETAVRLAQDCQPDVVVMDIALPGQSGIETTRQLLARHPGIKVLALSTYLDRGIVQQMLDIGASGYIAKSAAGIELKQGIHAVSGGRRYVSSEVVAVLADSLQQQPSPPCSSEQRSLSPRETQVAALLAEGKSAHDIAAVLHISPSTVDVHRRNLMRKLGLHKVAELTRYALRVGLILP